MLTPGRDSFCTAIVHCEGDIVVLDAIVEQRPPFNPSEAARDAAALLKSYKITECRGDKYAAGFVVEAFGRHGVQYRYCDNDTSTNYLEALPMLNAGRVRLVDDRRLVEQFCGLARKTSTSGRDRVDHGGADRHDDLAAATAGAIVLAASRAASPGMLEFYKWLVRGEAPDSPLGEPQVRVRAPPHVSHLRTLSGLELAVPADRVLELAESDAKPLIGLAGWTRA